MTGSMRSIKSASKQFINPFLLHRSHKAYTAIQIPRRILGFGLVSLAVAIALLAQVVLPDGEEPDIPRYHYEWRAETGDER